MKVIPVAFQVQLVVFLFLPVVLHLCDDRRRNEGRGQPLMGHSAHGGFDINGPPFGDKGDIGENGGAIKARQQQNGQQKVAEPMTLFFLFSAASLGGLGRRGSFLRRRGSAGLGLDHKIRDLASLAAGFRLPLGSSKPGFLFPPPYRLPVNFKGFPVSCRARLRRRIGAPDGGALRFLFQGR